MAGREVRRHRLLKNQLRLCVKAYTAIKTQTVWILYGTGFRPFFCKISLYGRTLLDIIGFIR